MAISGDSLILTHAGYRKVAELKVGEVVPTPLGDTEVTCAVSTLCPWARRTQIRLTPSLAVIGFHRFYCNVLPGYVSRSLWWGDFYLPGSFDLALKLGLPVNVPDLRTPELKALDLVTLIDCPELGYPDPVVETQEEHYQGWYLGTKNRLAIVGPCVVIADYALCYEPSMFEPPPLRQQSNRSNRPPDLTAADVTLFSRWVSRMLRTPGFIN